MFNDEQKKNQSKQLGRGNFCDAISVASHTCCVRIEKSLLVQLNKLPNECFGAA